MTIKQTTFFSLIAGVTLLTACKNNSKYPGFESNENGLNYQFYKQAEGGEKPKMGEFVKVKITNKLYPDSLLFSSAKASADGTIQYPLQDQKFKACLEEGLLMMSVGDSASFLISSDSIHKYFPPRGGGPSIFPTGSMQKFSIRLMAVIPKEVVMKKQQEDQEAAMKQYEQYQKAEIASIEKYVADNKITVKPTASGLYFVERKKGTGPLLHAGQTAMVLYSGKYLNGEVFDASEKHGGTPIEVQVGNGGVIQGWQDALMMMQNGTKATVLIPSSIGYGADGGGRMPPCTPMVFEMEVVGVK